MIDIRSKLKWLRRPWAYVLRIADAYDRHLDALMAAAVSFYVLLSIVPLLSVGVAVLGWFVGGSREAISEVRGVVQAYVPADSRVIFDTLASARRGSGFLGLLGLAGTLFTASAIFTNLEMALNNTWGVERMRRWWKQRLVALGTTLLSLSLLFLSVGATSLLTYIESVRLPVLGYQAARLPFIWEFVGYLVPLVVSVAMFTLLYKIVPNKPISWREAAVGGLVAGAGWELAKHLFAVYLTRFGNYDRLYGSLGGAVILIVWTYYSASVLFVGAEVAADCGTKLPAADGPPSHVPHRQ